MSKRWFALAAVGLAWLAAAMVLAETADLTGRQPSVARNLSGLAWASAPEAEPTLFEVVPSSAPNDLDTPIVITGTGFTAVPTVTLGTTVLAQVGWVSSALLTATVPWGLDAGPYTMTVANPDGSAGTLPNAFTVTQGIGAWTAAQLYGGGVEQVVLNPDTPATVYAVAGKVGVFRSRDGGEEWSLVHAPCADDLALDPITPTTVYWGCGKLYRSDDELDTQHYLGEPMSVPYPHPTVSQTLYASNRGGNGLWKSADRGETWLSVTNGLTDTEVTGLVYHPIDPMTMYVGTANGNVFSSTNGGGSWSRVAQPLNYILTLGINPRGDHELWISNHCVNAPNETLKSTNPGHTDWVAVGAPVGAESLESIDFPPPAWGEVFSQTVFAQGCWGTPYRTEDDGDTWQELPLSQAAVQDMALHPTIPETLYGGTKREGVLKSEDGGQTYRWINEGITALYPLQMTTILGQPDLVYATTDREGGIYRGTGGGADWQFLDIEGLDGTSSVVAVDPFTPTRVYVGDRSQDGTASWVLHVSEDSGQTWTTTVISATDAYSDCENTGIMALRPDPALPGHLLAGIDHVRFGSPFFSAGGIYRSTDHGESWTYIDAGEPISGVSDIAFDPLLTDTVYAATVSPAFPTGSGMLRSTNSGAEWEPMGDDTAALDQVWSLAAEPRTPHRLFAMTSGHGLYRSADHGTTWQLATPWLVSEQILCTDEASPVLYAATGDGLLRSEDGGQSWSSAAGVLGRVPVYSLATVRDGERVFLYAGTTGGYVEGSAPEALGQANAEGTLVNAGIYRYTTLRTSRTCLPLVLRHSP